MSTLLIFTRGELCVCELMDALGESQPKVSRHLGSVARMRTAHRPTARAVGVLLHEQGSASLGYANIGGSECGQRTASR